MKRQPTEGKKIPARHISEKELTSKTQKKFIQLINRKRNRLKNEQRNSVDIFPKETYKWATDTWKGT